MADETPSGTPPSGSIPKKETVRITLPSKPGDAPVVKRETVRLPTSEETKTDAAAASADPVLKGQTIRISPMGAAPKKETTRVSTGPILPVSTPPSAPPSAVAPPPAFPKPASVPPLKPLGAPGGGLPPIKPMSPPSGAGMPPKPPGVGPKPTVALGQPPKPATPPSGSGVTPVAPAAPAAPGAPAAPVAAGIKAAPKKETARIQVAPSAAGGPVMPKATVKMQQTQPMVPMAAPAAARVEKLAVAQNEEPAGTDSWTMILSVVATVAAAGAAFICYTAYTAITAIQP